MASSPRSSPLIDLVGCEGSSCAVLILEYLPVKEVVSQLGATCQSLHKASKQEVERRARQWKDFVTLEWSVRKNEAKQHVYAYEVPYEEARATLNDFYQFMCPTKAVLLDTIASWCGGYGPLLAARETKALKQNYASDDEFAGDKDYTTPGPKERQVWIYDIKCDGKLVSSAILPLGVQERYRYDFNCLEETAFSPHTGDFIDTRSLFNPHRENAKWFLSTNASDKREWCINVSIISPSCSETLICSRSFVPSKLVARVDSGKGKWKEYSHRTHSEGGTLDREVLSATNDDTFIWEDILVVVDEEDDGFLCYPDAEIASDLSFCVDRRPKDPSKQRFHAMFWVMGMDDEDTKFNGHEDMVVRPQLSGCCHCTGCGRLKRKIGDIEG